MSTLLLFQSLFNSVHDRIYITDIQEERPSLKTCYCIWADRSEITILLKNELNRQEMTWNLASNIATYNGVVQAPGFLQEVIHILNNVAQDLVSGRASVFKGQKGEV